MNVVILAAGQGKRMNSAHPKVLHVLASRPLLGHVIDSARQLAADRIVVVHGHGGDQVRAAFPASDLSWVRQAEQLGTGHALAQALPLIDPALPVLVLYGDVPLTRVSTLRRLIMAGAEGIGLLTVHLDDPNGYGRIVRDNHGHVQRIVEQKDADAATLALTEVNTGMLCLPGNRLEKWLGRLSNRNAQGEYYLTDVIAMAVAEGLTVHTSHPDDAWETLGVNAKDQLAELERIHQQQLAKQQMAAGVGLADPLRFDLRGTLDCGRDVFIDVGCVFEGTVTLGHNVRIGPYCVLRDVTIADGTEIAAFCHLDGSRIGRNSRLGPYARTRPGTTLGDAVHIGNFVEVKNSCFEDGAKANHLAYVGDADIGQRVNIGAGTITCNYDGANKHRTVIEDDAFIGSDSQLVAPVRVGRGATLGAGTTLTKDAPPDSLTVSRTRQVSVPSWKRPQKTKPER